MNTRYLIVHQFLYNVIFMSCTAVWHQYENVLSMYLLLFLQLCLFYRVYSTYELCSMEYTAPRYLTMTFLTSISRVIARRAGFVLSTLNTTVTHEMHSHIAQIILYIALNTRVHVAFTKWIHGHSHKRDPLSIVFKPKWPDEPWP